MEGLDINQLWRYIPPEEKFEIMARSHSKGTTAACIGVLAGITLAICLKQPWLIWGSILACPLIFDAASVKAWKHLKPRVILEYLAARAAARRFAFSLNSSRLGVAALVRGNLKEIKATRSSEESMEEEQHIEEKTIPVWVALFHDALIVISEQAGGAKLEVGQLLARNIEAYGESSSGMGEYSSDRNLIVNITNIAGFKQSFNISSPHPAALVVLEKKLNHLIQECKSTKGIVEELAPSSLADDDDFLTTHF